LAQSLQSAFYQRSNALAGNQGLFLAHSLKRSFESSHPKMKGKVPEALAELSASYSSTLTIYSSHLSNFHFPGRMKLSTNEQTILA